MAAFKKLLIFFSLVSVAGWVFSEEKPNVWVQGDTVYYQGSLSKEQNETLYNLYGEHADQIKWLSIESKGGEIDLGLDLGDFIFANKLGVIVETYCLSSCANYVFTSGNEKILSGNAVLGFHGGASSTEFDTTSLDSLPEQAKAKAVKQLQDYLEAVEKREKAFFEKIGVEQRITTLGQDDKYKDYQGSDYVGWYYSIEDLAKLGVKNISVNAPVWEPKQLSENAKILKISVTDD